MLKLSLGILYAVATLFFSWGIIEIINPSSQIVAVGNILPQQNSPALMQTQGCGIYACVVTVGCAVIVWVGFRRRQRWAWIALAMTTTLTLLGESILCFSYEDKTSAYIMWAGLYLAWLGLLLPFKQFFQKKNRTILRISPHFPSQDITQQR